MKRASGAGAQGVLSSRWFHLAVLALGSAFLLVGAFHGYIWFDESYSVAIANHSFSEIWRIGSGDVHPVLFYWALHVLNLVFGQNILVYRLFTVLGSIALASLGYTHVRRDFGWKPGVLFTAFVLFIPYTAIMSTEIRMYSWATFSVMLCALTAWRIACALREPACEGSVACVQKRAQGKRLLAGAPLSWWVVFAVSSLFSAYLHYFGAMSAFMVNLLLLIFCINRAARRRGAAALGVLVASAVIQVALYAPWLMVLVHQMGVVSNTYWANMVFPVTYIEFATYPVRTSFVHFALEGSYGAAPQVVGRVLLAATLVWLCAWAVWSLVRLVKPHVLAGERAEGGSCAATGKAAGGEDFGERAAVGFADEGSSCSANSSDEGGVLPADSARVPESPRAQRDSLSRRLAVWASRDSVAPVLCALAIYLGVFAISFSASILMDSLIVYYRYLGVAIGPLLFAAVMLLSRIRSRALVGAACAILLSVSVLNMTLLVGDFYSSDNQEALDEVRQTVDRVTQENDGKVPLVVSSDIGYISLTSLAYPDISQTYMDWQKGNWNLAYEAYSPTLTCKNSWEEILGGYHGPIVVLGQTQNGVMSRDVEDLSKRDGFELRESGTRYRPYERAWFTVAVIDKD